MEKMELNSEQSNIGEAIAFIELQRQQCMAVGANDYEPSAFEELLIAVKNGKLDPLTAKQKAAAILESKQDYH